MGLRLVDAVSKSALPKPFRYVATLYARKANDKDGCDCFPGVDWIADKTGLKPSAVRQQRNALIRMGVLQAETLYRGKRKLVKVVAFCADRLPQATQFVRYLPTPHGYRGTGDRYPGTAEAASATPVPLSATPVPPTGTGVPPTSKYKQRTSPTEVQASVLAFKDCATPSAPRLPGNDVREHEEDV